MKTHLRWLSIGVVGLILAAIPAMPQDSQYELDPSHQSSALMQTVELDNSNSAMQHSATARQNTAEEALKKLRQQTSPEHETGWDWASTISAVVLIAAFIGLITVYRRPAPRRWERVETRRAA